MGHAEEWRRLVGLVADDDEVVRRVVAAVDAGDDPWEALLDGLDEVGALAYLRAGDTGMELVDALVELPKVFAAQLDLDEASDIEDLGAAAALADGVLTQTRLGLLLLVEDENSWPLVVVNEDHVDETIALAATLGRQARRVR